jgi:hypothetical protein
MAIKGMMSYCSSMGKSKQLICVHCYVDTCTPAAVLYCSAAVQSETFSRLLCSSLQSLAAVAAAAAAIRGASD